MAGNMLRLLCAMVLGAGLIACEGTGAATATTGNNGDDAAPAKLGRVGLIPQFQPPIADLPVPIGFKLAEKISRTYESGGTRTVDHTYEGRDDKFDVDRFYVEQMPLKGWKAKAKRMERGVITQTFEKDNELATVVISDAKGLTTNRTSIHITVQTVN